MALNVNVGVGGDIGISVLVLKHWIGGDKWLVREEAVLHIASH